MHCHPRTMHLFHWFTWETSRKAPVQCEVAAYPEKHPSYFPYADNRSWIVGRVCFQPSLTWLGICRTCVIFTMSWASSGRGLSDTTFIVMPLSFSPVTLFSWYSVSRDSWRLCTSYFSWFFEGFLLQGDCDEYLLTRICRQSVGALSTSIETGIPICSLAFGLITRRITKWIQWVGGRSICTSSRARVETL